SLSASTQRLIRRSDCASLRRNSKPPQGGPLSPEKKPRSTPCSRLSESLSLTRTIIRRWFLLVTIRLGFGLGPMDYHRPPLWSRRSPRLPITNKGALPYSSHTS